MLLIRDPRYRVHVKRRLEEDPHGQLLRRSPMPLVRPPPETQAQAVPAPY